MLILATAATEIEGRGGERIRGERRVASPHHDRRLRRCARLARERHGGGKRREVERGTGYRMAGIRASNGMEADQRRGCRPEID